MQPLYPHMQTLYRVSPHAVVNLELSADASFQLFSILLDHENTWNFLRLLLDVGGISKEEKV